MKNLGSVNSKQLLMLYALNLFGDWEVWPQALKIVCDYCVQHNRFSTVVCNYLCVRYCCLIRCWLDLCSGRPIMPQDVHCCVKVHKTQAWVLVWLLFYSSENKTLKRCASGCECAVECWNPSWIESHGSVMLENC